MTYKDVIDRFQQVANQHYMIKDFGYGQLSDIKVHSEDGEADYPYLFLNPTTHTRTGTVMTYEFNMIMMDIAIDEDDPFGNWINIQSQCQQYIDDVFAQLYYGYTDQPLIDYSNVTYTPFKERFQDSLAGMTAAISIEVPTPINQCIAPIQPLVPPPPVGELALSVAMTQDQLFDPDTQQSPLRFQDIIVDTQGGWRPPAGSNFYIPTISGTWNWVFEGTTRLELDQGDWPNDPEMQYRSPAALIQPTTSTWPTEQPAVGVSVPFKVEWTNEYYEADGEFIAWNFINDPQPEDRFYIETGSTLKGYFIPTI